MDKPYIEIATLEGLRVVQVTGSWQILIQIIQQIFTLIKRKKCLNTITIREVKK